jgi:hypothetical protein
MLEALSYQRCCLSVHGLKESGSEIELQYSAPCGWDRFGDVFISTSGHPDRMFEYSAFHFLETNSLQRFLLILRQKRQRTRSGYWTEESLRVRVVEAIPDCSEFSPRWSNLSEKEKLALFLSSANRGNRDVEGVWLDSFVKQLCWQHPVGKWWISVVVKRGIVSDQRVNTAHISWHTPKAD